MRNSEINFHLFIYIRTTTTGQHKKASEKIPYVMLAKLMFFPSPSKLKFPYLIIGPNLVPNFILPSNSLVNYVNMSWFGIG
jgi:hypothetical protein